MMLSVHDPTLAHGSLELKRERSADGAQDVHSAALLALFHLAQKAVGILLDKEYGSAARFNWRAVGNEPLLDDHDAWRARAAKELVWGHKNGILVAVGVSGARVHVNRHIGTRSGVVKEGQRAVAVQQRRYRICVF